MRERIRSHLSYANVMATIAVFLVLSGGTAVALSGSNTFQSNDLGPGAQVKAADVAANATDSPDITNNSLSLSDLNATSRPHMLEFSGPSGTSLTTFATVGNPPSRAVPRRPRGIRAPILTAGGPQEDHESSFRVM